jgi:hypothetical protein
VYYEGDHDDFVDTDDDVTINRENGTVTMSSASSARGSSWETAIEGQYVLAKLLVFTLRFSKRS